MSFSAAARQGRFRRELEVYMNFKLSKTRFYVMFSHVNQGLFGGDNWFSMPGYPLNPRRFQLGLSIDFAN